MIAQQPADQPLAGYTIRSALAAPDREAAEWDGMLPGSGGDFYLCYDWLASIRGTKGYEQTWSIYDRNGHLAGLVPICTTPEPINNQFYNLYALFGDTPGGAADRLPNSSSIRRSVPVTSRWPPSLVMPRLRHLLEPEQVPHCRG